MEAGGSSEGFAAGIAERNPAKTARSLEDGEQTGHDRAAFVLVRGSRQLLQERNVWNLTTGSFSQRPF